MIKSLSIIGIVLSLALFFVTVYFAETAQNSRRNHYSYNEYIGSDYEYGAYEFGDEPIYTDRERITAVAGSVTMVFFLFFSTLSILWLKMVKRMAATLFAIFTLSLSGIMVLFDFVVIATAEPDFDDIAPFWILYTLHIIAFSIVGLVQVVKFERAHKPSLQPIASAINADAQGTNTDRNGSIPHNTQVDKSVDDIDSIEDL